MAKAIKTIITLPHSVTVKVDKLEGRTLRTVKVGDYLATSLDVRGVECSFYTRVVSVSGNEVSTRFGSGEWVHGVVINKGDKVDVYRPL